jgi:hypothetical protein
MCKANWTTDNVNAEVIIVAPLVRPAEVIDHLMPGPERRESHIFMATLFDQWLVRQPIHDPLIHADVECDVCELNVDDIGVMVAVRRREFGPMSMPEPFNTHHFLKHIGCGHAICSTCLLVKRFLFVNLGLPVCCNVCKVCWLKF